MRAIVAAVARTAVLAIALIVAGNPEPAVAAGRGSPPPMTPPAKPVSTAATLYALNCMGCHAPPRSRELDRGPLRGEFHHTDKGRNFFIRMPAEGRRLSAAEEAALLEEVLTWKRGCAAIRQDSPMVNYYGDPHAR